MRLYNVLLIVTSAILVVAFLLLPLSLWLLSIDPDMAPEKLDAKEWIALYAVVAAISGWLFAAAVQIRNSVKQHTVNTMLQSRLSTAFQERATKLYSVYPTLTGVTPIKKEDLHSQEARVKEALEAARFMLNYYEFIAVGIRSGDFDEALMRKSWRKIVVTLHTLTRELISHLRGETSTGETTYPMVYEHFIWLVERWQTEDDARIYPTPPSPMASHIGAQGG